MVLLPLCVLTPGTYVKTERAGICWAPTLKQPLSGKGEWGEQLLLSTFQLVAWHQRTCQPDKQNVVYAYKQVLFSLRKDENPDTGCNMDKPEDITLSEISWSQKNKYWMVPLIGGNLKWSNSKGQKAKWWLPEIGGKGKWGVVA